MKSIKKETEIQLIKKLIKIKQERASLEPCNLTKALIKTEIDAHVLKLSDLIAEGDGD